MIFIDTLIIFFLGIIFVQWIIPFIDGILNLFLTSLEVLKGKMVVKINDYQKQTQEPKKDNFSQIGFAILEEEEDDSDE